MFFCVSNLWLVFWMFRFSTICWIFYSILWFWEKNHMMFDIIYLNVNRVLLESFLSWILLFRIPQITVFIFRLLRENVIHLQKGYHRNVVLQYMIVIIIPDYPSEFSVFQSIFLIFQLFSLWNYDNVIS